MSKINVSLIFRKPVKNNHYSIENVYNSFFRRKDNRINFKKKIAPFESSGIFKRLGILIWSFFQQADINHNLGDINFASIFLKRKKTIITILDCYLMKKLKGIKKVLYLYFWLIIPAMRCSKVITISEESKKQIIKYTGIKKNKIIVIPCGVSPIFKKKLKIFNNTKPNILIIGTAENKNIERIIKATINISCMLTIIGKLQNKHLELLKKTKTNFKNYINLSNSEIYNQYVQSDFVVFVSLYEGFGLPIIEAQTVSRPVITSNKEPMKTIAGSGALLANPRETSDIRKKILLLINNKGLQKKLILLGLANARNYSEKNMFKKYCDVYINHFNCNY